MVRYILLCSVLHVFTYREFLEFLVKVTDDASLFYLRLFTYDQGKLFCFTKRWHACWSLPIFREQKRVLPLFFVEIEDKFMVGETTKCGFCSSGSMHFSSYLTKIHILKLWLRNQISNSCELSRKWRIKEPNALWETPDLAPYILEKRPRS